jgi:hypothetical protein
MALIFAFVVFLFREIVTDGGPLNPSFSPEL